MNSGEVTRYADMHEAVRTYTEIGKQALEIYLKFEALQSLKSLSPDQRQRREELLQQLLQYERIMQNVANQFSEALEAAGKAALQ
jgi:phasin family protein